jgi:hypothetical protein
MHEEEWKMSRKLTLAEQWMKNHPDDTPCPPGSGGAARAWRLKRGLGGSAAWARTKAKRKAEHKKAPPLVSLEAMLRRAAKETEKAFNKFGGIDMCWLVDSPTEGQGLIVTPANVPPGAPPELEAAAKNIVKSSIAEKMRELFREKNVTRYVHIFECWTLERAKTEATMEDLCDEVKDAGGSISNMPDRLEAMVFYADDGRESIVAMRKIIRAAERKPYLGALEILDGEMGGGRFTNMLPIQNATSH